MMHPHLAWRILTTPQDNTCQDLNGYIIVASLSIYITSQVTTAHKQFNQISIPFLLKQPTFFKNSCITEDSISPNTMSSETSMSNITTEPPTTAAVFGSLTFNDTELTLGLPGESRNSGVKRRFSDIIDLKLGGADQSDSECSVVTKSPPAK